MATLCYFVGVVGTGKTTVARKMCGENELFLDSDALRAELLGSEENQSNNALIFNEMQNRTVDALNRGQNVFYVACNIWSKKRIQFLKSLRQRVKEPFEAKCFVVEAPIEVCRERNSARSRVVPAYVIDKQLRQFEIPYFGEGWDTIEIIHNYTVEEGQDSYDMILNKVYDFGAQKNEHHTLTLWNHCNAAFEYAAANHFSPHICGAALLHDYGKAWTAEYWDKDNRKNLHFPNHANVGAWLALNQGMSLRAVQLINYHMLHYTDEKCQATWRARLGEELWHDLALLHEADEAAH